jgi:GR25 family glycosyltransferase involved in LPS biosynthesis
MSDLLHPNTFFDKIYCINLERRPDRWINVKSKFDRLGIDVERFIASDGKDIKNLPETSFFNHFMNKSEYGCLMSHKRVVEDAKKNGYKRVLILEDDVLFHKDFMNLFQRVKDAPEWDMLFLGCNSIVPKHKIQEELENQRGFMKATIESGSYAYAIDQKFYDEYLNKINTFKYAMASFLVELRTPDELLRFFYNQNQTLNINFIKSILPSYLKKTNLYKKHYAMLPKIILTDISETDIIPKRINQEAFLKRNGANADDYF